MARWMCESVGMRRDVTVEVSAADRARLEAVVADRNSPQKHVWRAKIILATADGLGTAEIMRRSGKSKPSVWRWQERFMTDGVDSARQDAAVADPALAADDHRSRDRADGDRTAAPGHPLDGGGDGQGHRDQPLLGAAHLAGAQAAAPPGALLQALHRPAVRRQAARPRRALHRSAGACRGPLGRREVADPSPHRTQPGLPLKKGRCATMTHDYKRHGTTTLFAALDVLEGKVIGRCMQRHRHQEFIRFLNGIEATVPVGKVVHVILDNYATHKHPKVKTWLERHPRFVFHFTPTSCSWLNAVEGFFAKLTKRRLQRGVFRSIIELQAAINRFLDQANDNPKPFVWTADPDKIIAAVKRGHQALDSIH